MEKLFAPESVAVIGASENEEKVGFKVLENVIAGGFKGVVYPVNPRGGEILGRRVYTSLDEVPGPVDVAAIVIPARHVYEAVSQCARKKVRYAVIISSGFSEVGNDGEEKRIVDLARANGMRVLGPNVLGYYSAAGSLNLTFGPTRVLPGGVAIISQSGALGIALMGKTVVDNLRLSAFMSIGNKADMDESDLLDHLMEDGRTSVIMIYMEGVKQGRRLLETLAKTTLRKPVIMVKAGGSSRGARAAASHTGALASSDEVFSAVMKQCNVSRAESLSEALDWCFFFSSAPLPGDGGALVLTNGGGLGVMAADAAEKYGLELYDDPDVLKKVFGPLVPGFGSTGNPVDITAGQDHTVYGQVLEAALGEPGINAAAVLYCQVAMCDVHRLGRVIREQGERFRAAGKPMVFVPVGDGDVDTVVKEVRARMVPVVDDPYLAMSCLGSARAYVKGRRTDRAGKSAGELLSTEALRRIETVVESVSSEGRDFLLADEGWEVLRAAGVGLPASRVAADADEAVRAAEGIGFPVAMKVVSPDILHKSDAGGVLLNVSGPDEVSAGFEKIRANSFAYKAGVRFQGVEVSEMVRPGLEMIVGARRDDSFGPIVMCGLGGIYVEVMKDIVFRAFPLGRGEAEKMIDELKARPMLSGVRGARPSDTRALVDTVLRVGAVVDRCPVISDLEVNPLFLYEEGLKAVDVRVMLAASE